MHQFNRYIKMKAAFWMYLQYNHPPITVKQFTTLPLKFNAHSFNVCEDTTGSDWKYHRFTVKLTYYGQNFEFKSPAISRVVNQSGSSSCTRCVLHLEMSLANLVGLCRKEYEKSAKGWNFIFKCLSIFLSSRSIIVISLSGLPKVGLCKEQMESIALAMERAQFRIQVADPVATLWPCKVGQDHSSLSTSHNWWTRSCTLPSFMYLASILT